MYMLWRRTFVRSVDEPKSICIDDYRLISNSDAHSRSGSDSFDGTFLQRHCRGDSTETVCAERLNFPSGRKVSFGWTGGVCFTPAETKAHGGSMSCMRAR